MAQTSGDKGLFIAALLRYGRFRILELALIMRLVAPVHFLTPALLAVAGVANAAEPFGALGQGPGPRLFEARLGVFAHDPISPEKGGADINAEFLVDVFGPRDRSRLWGVLTPRLHVGGTGNTGGKTSQAYAGFTWTWDITPRIFIEGGFGGAIHNGKTQLLAPPGFNAMGCSWGFHEQATLGYRLTQAWSVMVTVEHTSNSGICKQNRGLTNVGMRLGYSF